MAKPVTPLALHRFQQRELIGERAFENQRAAGLERDPHLIQAIAERERQDRQDDIGFRLLQVLGNRIGRRQQAEMGRHHAFRPPRRSRGIYDRRQIEVDASLIGRRNSFRTNRCRQDFGERDQTGAAGPRLGQRTRQPHRLQMRAFDAYIPGGLQLAGVGGQCRGPAVSQQVREFVLLSRRVHDHQHRARFQHAKDCQNGVDRVVEIDRDTVALLHAIFDQAGRKEVRAIVQLAIREPPPAADQRDLIGQPRSRMFENFL